MLKLLKLMGKRWWPYLLAVVFLFVQALANLNLPRLMSEIINQGVLTNDIATIWSTGGYMLLITALGGLATVAASYLVARTGASFAQTIREKLFTTVTYASTEQFNKFGTASLITRTTNDITQIQQMMVMSRMMILSPILGIGGVIMAVRQAPSLSWLIAVIVGIVFVIMGIVGLFVMPQFKVVQKRLDKLNLVLREFLTGIRVIRAFNRSDDEKKRFDKANRNLMDTSLRIFRIISLLFPVMMLIMSASSIFIIWFGGHQLEGGSIQIGDLMAFIQYVMQIMMSVLMFTFIFVMVPRAQVSAKRINKVLDSKNTLKDATDETLDFDKIRGKIEFKNVTFRHKGAEEPVLKNISFVAEPGEITAIIGGTGSGKSTLIDLIPRFYDVESGEILIDDIPIKDIPMDTLRHKIGLVPQKAVLFSGSIRENIAYGKPDATDEEIRMAAEIAQALPFIEDKEEGFNTYISQGGKNVSGGQKQRLCIARALVRNPEVYIFDDSFSALDFKTDAKLRRALKTNLSHTTQIIVAQRVNTIMDADKILVIDEGKIVGQGTHAELFKDNPVYREVVLSQLSEEEIA